MTDTEALQILLNKIDELSAKHQLPAELTELSKDIRRDTLIDLAGEISKSQLIGFTPNPDRAPTLPADYVNACHVPTLSTANIMTNCVEYKNENGNLVQVPINNANYTDLIADSPAKQVEIVPCLCNGSVGYKPDDTPVKPKRDSYDKIPSAYLPGKPPKGL